MSVIENEHHGKIGALMVNILEVLKMRVFFCEKITMWSENSTRYNLVLN